MSLVRVACIVGPTASGKSDVAELVAMQLGGEVVSVDSMQVYRGMDIGTAKLDPAHRRVPLHMVDVTDVGTTYSVAQFQRDARACCDAIAAEGGVPVLCGGTGLYLDAVIDQLEFPTGEVIDERRTAYERLARDEGPQALYAMLLERDARSAALIHPNNVRRVIRALELCDDGQSYATRNEGLRQHQPYYDAALWALVWPREVLYARIDKRVEQMFADGLVDEVRALDAQGLRTSQTASQAIGYKEVLQLVDGLIDLEEAKNLVKRNTRHYAKRQLSWLQRDGRADMIDLSTCSPTDAALHICKEWERHITASPTPEEDAHGTL